MIQIYKVEHRGFAYPWNPVEVSCWCATAWKMSWSDESFRSARTTYVALGTKLQSANLQTSTKVLGVLGEAWVASSVSYECNQILHTPAGSEMLTLQDLPNILVSSLPGSLEQQKCSWWWKVHQQLRRIRQDDLDIWTDRECPKDIQVSLCSLNFLFLWIRLSPDITSQLRGLLLSGNVHVIIYEYCIFWCSFCCASVMTKQNGRSYIYH